MTAPRPLVVVTLRDCPYAAGLARQCEVLAAMRRDPAAPETIIFAEHRPVVTLGRRAAPGHLRLSREALAARGVEVAPTTRGGDVTYHGPGQWTVYPLLRLGEFCPDLHRYLRLLEETAIVYLAGRGVQARRRAVNSGVWVGRDKICAVGVACSAWISWHGFALNVQPDLGEFTEAVVPCGIAPEDGGVTSLARETGRRYDMEEEKGRILAALREVFAEATGRRWEIV